MNSRIHPGAGREAALPAPPPPRTWAGWGDTGDTSDNPMLEGNGFRSARDLGNSYMALGEPLSSDPSGSEVEPWGCMGDPVYLQIALSFFPSPLLLPFSSLSPSPPPSLPYCFSPSLLPAGGEMEASIDIPGMLPGTQGGAIAAGHACFIYRLPLVHQWDTEATLPSRVLPAMPNSLCQQA